MKKPVKRLVFLRAQYDLKDTKRMDIMKTPVLTLALISLAFAVPARAETMALTLPMTLVSGEKAVIIPNYAPCANKDYPIGLKSNASKADVVCAPGGGACSLKLSLRSQIKDPLYYYVLKDGTCQKTMYEGEGQVLDRGVYQATLVYPETFAVQQYGKRMLPVITSKTKQQLTSKYVKADKEGEVKAILTYSFIGAARPANDVLVLGPNEIQVNFQY